MKSGLAWAVSSPLLAWVSLGLGGCGSDPPSTPAPSGPATEQPAADPTPAPGPVPTGSQSEPPPPPPATPARIKARGAALFQGVKLPLYGEDVNAGSSAALPVVVARPGVFRTYVDLLQTSTPEQTRVVFVYKSKDGTVQRLEQTTLIQNDSKDEVDGSCIDIALPADVFHPALEYATEVYEATENRLVARFPETEGSFAPLPANPQSKTLKVVVVPVQYEADGSDRLPDTSPAQVKRLSEELRALYPVSEVELTVRPQPLLWTEEIRANGRGWDELLYGILQLRETDAVADDVYYYGAFSPAVSLQSFCSGGGCVLGLSELSSSVGDAGRRGSIGLGFTGGDAAETFTHELGHAHGRYHAPCGGAGGPDQRFPYSGGGIGVTGWDVRTSTFVLEGGLRTATKDFMGYCSPSWVSDYTWKALFTRIVGIGEKLAEVSTVARVRYQLLRVEDGQEPRWLGSRTGRGTISDDRVEATLPGGQHQQLAQVELDHLPGHVVYVPATLSGKSIRVAGVAAPITVP